MPIVARPAAEHALAQQVERDVHQLPLAQRGVVRVERKLLVDHVEIRVRAAVDQP